MADPAPRMHSFVKMTFALDSVATYRGSSTSMGAGCRSRFGVLDSPGHMGTVTWSTTDGPPPENQQSY